jgi:D-glycero-alpha-D-manno-heptose-7-phosphate kinase
VIITKTPLRISFAGGGSDLPAFYENEEYGAVLSATIDKYVYIALHRYFENKFLLKYSQSEIVDHPREIQHPLIRESLLVTNTTTPLEITSFADIPASGSGLGSSSAFCVGLLHALHVFNNMHLSAQKLAELACHIEIERLQEPIGKQDQHASALGGINYMRFNPDGTVFVQKINLPLRVRKELESNLLLFYTGNTRSTKSILTEQKHNTINDAHKRTALVQMRNLADDLREALQQHDLTRFGHILHQGWLLKRQLAGGITNEQIDSCYDKAMQAGALGGKLLGAGGGGFLLFYVPQDKHKAVRDALKDLRELEFSFDLQGTRLAHIDS